MTGNTNQKIISALKTIEQELTNNVTEATALLSKIGRLSYETGNAVKAYSSLYCYINNKRQYDNDIMIRLGLISSVDELLKDLNEELSRVDREMQDIVIIIDDYNEKNKQ